MIPFTYLCPWLLSSAFVRFWLLALPSYLFHDFHLLEPLPLRQRKGFFLPPKHSHEKFFRKFFQNYPRRLFADFLARICDEGNGCLPLAIGGGYPLLWGCGFVVAPLLCLPSFPRSSLAPALSLVAFPLSLWASVPYWLTASGRLVLLCSSFCWVALGFRSSVPPRTSREHQDHRQQGQRGCRSFLPLGPDWLIASAQLRQDLSTEIAPNEGKIG